MNSADGKFRAQLPQGKYTVRRGSVHTTLTALSGGTYHLDLQKNEAFDFQVTADTADVNQIKLHVHAEGSGAHTLEIRTSNLELGEQGTQKIELRPGRDVDFSRTGKIIATGTPWVVVVIPDGILNEHQEITGSNPTK